MSLKVKPTMNKEYAPVPSGNHIGRLIQIIDLGNQRVEWKGEEKIQPKVRFTFELSSELKEYEGVKKPMVIGGTYTLSMGSKAKLRPMVEGILGVSLRDDEAANFDLEKFKELLGTPVMVNVVHATKGDRTYANIAGVAPVPKGVTVPEQFNESLIFEIDDRNTPELFEALPKFVQEMIMKSEEAVNGLTDSDSKSLEKLRNAHNSKVEEEEEDLASSIPF